MAERDTDALQMAARYLLQHPMTCREHDPDPFAIIRRHEQDLDLWFTQRLGYRLHVSSFTARLFKTTIVPHRPVLLDQMFDNEVIALLLDLRLLMINGDMKSLPSSGRRRVINLSVLGLIAAEVPIHLSACALANQEVRIQAQGPVLLVENPRIVEAAAERKIQRCIISTNGDPSTAVMKRVRAMLTA